MCVLFLSPKLKQITSHDLYDMGMIHKGYNSPQKALEHSCGFSELEYHYEILLFLLYFVAKPSL